MALSIKKLANTIKTYEALYTPVTPQKELTGQTFGRLMELKQFLDNTGGKYFAKYLGRVINAGEEKLAWSIVFGYAKTFVARGLNTSIYCECFEYTNVSITLYDGGAVESIKCHIDVNYFHTIQFYESGIMLSESCYDNGTPLHYAKYYHSNGNLMESYFFDNGVINGARLYFTTEGKLWQLINYSKGIKQGVAMQYNLSGSVVSTRYYENDKLVEA